MKKEAEKIMQAGLGAIMLTKEAIEETVNDLVKKGKLGKGEAKKVIDDLAKKGKAAQGTIAKGIDSTMKNIMQKLDIPSRAEVEKLKNEIEELKKNK